MVNHGDSAPGSKSTTYGNDLMFLGWFAAALSLAAEAWTRLDADFFQTDENS